MSHLDAQESPLGVTARHLCLDYLAGRLGPVEFQKLLAALDMEAAGANMSVKTVEMVALYVAEYTGGHVEEDELKDLIGEALRTS